MKLLWLSLSFVRVSSAENHSFFPNGGQVVLHSRTERESTSQATSKAFSHTTEGHRRVQFYFRGSLYEINVLMTLSTNRGFYTRLLGKWLLWFFLLSLHTTGVCFVGTNYDLRKKIETHFCN